MDKATMVFIKYAEKDKKKLYLPQTVKDLLAGGLASISGLPILFPLDTKTTREQAKKPNRVKGQSARNFFKRHYKGVGWKALKVAPAMALTLTLHPMYKKLINKHVGTLKLEKSNT